jgi:hypothetical protein
VLNTDDPTLEVNIIESNLNVSVFPNPTNDFVTFEISNQEFSIVDVYNVAGVKVSSFAVENGVNEISLAEFGKGMYVLAFNGDSQVLTKRVIVK